MIRRFFHGMGFLLAAWGACRQARVRWLLFVPMLVNFACVAVLFRYGLTGVLSRWAVNQLALTLSPAYTAVVTIVARFVDIVVFVFVTYIALRFGAVLCSPLYGHIAEKVAGVTPGTHELPTRTAWADFVAALGYEWKKLGLSVLFAGSALLLAAIPGLGVVIDVAWGTLVGLVFVCLDYTDASFSRRRQTIRSRARELLAVFPEALGFALVALPLVSIPVVNLIAMPLCAAAGMLLAATAHNRAAAGATSSPPASMG